MNGELQICPGPGYVVAVLANMDPPAASRISNFITNRLPEPASSGALNGREPIPDDPKLEDQSQ